MKTKAIVIGCLAMSACTLLQNTSEPSEIKKRRRRDL
ncbi:hypothetical protein EDC44_1025 [Cricetibacter osteomyelitidis]|uniref:Lipoprotein n=1 Tax=Cricetibacter osteomyelitidis TaxID=1521931 RepID=A0A4R2TQB2_9PAST|nr:hypothetical protein EDC44_1025 [Cricetibacter osteomyelitidis]